MPWRRHGPATVSTLKEAEAFAAAGVRDLLYAVGIAPNKFARVVALAARGCDLSIILDSTRRPRPSPSVPGRAGDRSRP